MACMSATHTIMSGINPSFVDLCMVCCGHSLCFAIFGQKDDLLSDSVGVGTRD